MDLGAIIVTIVILLVALGAAVTAIIFNVGGAATAPVRDRVRPLIGPRLGRLTIPVPTPTETTVVPPRGTGSIERNATVLAPPDSVEPTIEHDQADALASPPREPATRVDQFRDETRDDVQEALRAALAAGQERFGQLEQRSEALAERIGRGVEGIGERFEKGLEDLRREATVRQTALDGRLAEVETRREQTVEHLRTELGRLAERVVRSSSERQRERQATALAELYEHFARLEASVAAVTNPVLLPGEPFAPPADLPADALIWDNWKDVGERVFAFAEYFNTRRVLLPEPLSRDVATFVVTLRAALTMAIYPNVRPHPSREQLASVRTGLAQLATEFSRLRARLEADYRALADAAPASPDS